MTCLISLIPASTAENSMNSRLGHVGDDLGERGLAGAGRPPEDQGTGIVAFDLYAQRLARADQMFLADILVERARAHAIGERTSRVSAGVRNWLKQAHMAPSPVQLN